MFEREVDDAIRGGSGLAETVEVVEVAAPNRRPSGRQGSGRRVGAREADNVMSSRQQFWDDGGTDVTGRARDEDPHGEASLREQLMRDDGNRTVLGR